MAGLFVVASLLSSTPAFASLPPGGTFLDDDVSVHQGDIEAIALLGITKGCNPPLNDRFCPSDVVTRGQMAAFLNRALGLPTTSEDFFTDDDSSIFRHDINRLAAAGIAFGCDAPSNTRFCPDAPITRDVMAAFLVRAFGYDEPLEEPRFVDLSDSQFVDEVNRLAKAGITKGCNPPANDRFCPSDPVTRAQMASFLTRALGLTPLVPPPRSPTLDFVPRDDWGAAEANTAVMTRHTIDTLTVHHAGDHSGTTGPARYRSWQSFHMSRGWGDVAYHYIIGIDGTVYEARDTAYKGDTGTNYDPAGHFLVVLEGNFEHDVPTASQLDSLVAVLAWASIEFEVSPSTIGGHRDHAATACPGGNLYPYIASGDLEADVRAAIREG